MNLLDRRHRRALGLGAAALLFLASACSDDDATAGPDEAALEQLRTVVEDLSGQVSELEQATEDLQGRIEDLEDGAGAPEDDAPEPPAGLQMSEDPLPGWFREYETGFVVPASSHLVESDPDVGSMLFIVAGFDSPEAWLEAQREAAGVGRCNEPIDMPGEAEAYEGDGLGFGCELPPVGGVGESGIIEIGLHPLLGPAGSLSALADQEGVYGVFVSVSVEILG